MEAVNHYLKTAVEIIPQGPKFLELGYPAWLITITPCLIALVAFIGTLKTLSKLEVTCEIVIDKPKNMVWPMVQDVSKWKFWYHIFPVDPNMVVNIDEDQKKLSYESQRVGTASVQKALEHEERVLIYYYESVKPFQQKIKFRFEFIEEEAADGKKQTRVSWTTKSRLPMYFFFLRRLFLGITTIDHERGLRNLKDLVEKAFVPSRITDPKTDGKAKDAEESIGGKNEKKENIRNSQNSENSQN